jgi:C4-dicarboxylate transporter DctM subunit
MMQIPAMVGDYLFAISTSPVVVMLIINVFLLVIGTSIDNISLTIILAPILLPIVVRVGVDPVHFGIIMTMNLAIGFSTPPYGITLFIASAVANTPVAKIIARTGPFLIAMLVCLIITTYVPSLSMFLPNLLK